MYGQQKRNIIHMSSAVSRDNRFQAAGYGFTWAGLTPADRASFAWRLPSLDHLVGAGEHRRRAELTVLRP
jgi:hypothetical protein